MVKWPPIVERAAVIMDTYDTGVTLRQLFYRLVSEQLIPNTDSYYSTLSDRTSKARREGTFPDFVDNSRRIHRNYCDKNPASAIDYAIRTYKLDRTIGQKHQVWLGVEKDGMVAQLNSWFGDDLGVPIIAMKGFPSQTYVNQIARDVKRDGRPAVLLYAGDFDPSGEDILRDFTERCPVWDVVELVALSLEQVEEYGLIRNPGKETDSRAKAFAEKYGENMQVEMDALDPNDLRDLFQAAIDRYWDESAFDEIMAREADDIAYLRDAQNPDPTTEETS